MSVFSSRPLATSQILMVLSALPAASNAPSGEKATDVTQSANPLRVRSTRPLAKSQSLTV